MLQVKAYAAAAMAAPLSPLTIERREPGTRDVLVDILYCGICHSDLSFVHGHFPFAHFPMVPGHEIVGRVAQVGSAVTRFQVGDTVGVGCMVDSCRSCPECQSEHEQYCPSMIPTYAGVERDGRTVTQGGYSARITVDEHFVVRIPASLSLAAAAPLLCAGITTYSPLRHWNVGRGSQVAVVGLGGLGHLAVKFASAMGAEVTVLSRTDDKKDAALKLGADDYAATSEANWSQPLLGRFDVILNTVSGNVDWDVHVGLLKRDGALIVLGVPEAPLTLSPYGLLMQRRSVAGSMIGGMRETQEMLDFCGEHGIAADIEMIPIQQVNAAFERIRKSDVRYRFVIGMASLP
jgi:uncharacterized zinc-type alcohol dehydrogenase-like protein